MRQRIRLTEGDLHRIVKESVKRALNEDFERDFYDNKDTQLNKELQLAAQLAKEGDKVGAIRSLQNAIDIVRNYDNLRG